MRIESPVPRLWHVCLYVIANWGIAAANDFALEEQISFPGNPVEPARVLNHNGPEILAQEINDQEVRAEMAKAAQFPDMQQLQDIKLTVISERWPEGHEPENVVMSASYILRYPSRQAKSQFSARFQSILRKSLQLRLVGHTRKFALASLATTPHARPLDADLASLLTQYPGLPHSWIKRWEHDGGFLAFI